MLNREDLYINGRSDMYAKYGQAKCIYSLSSLTLQKESNARREISCVWFSNVSFFWFSNGWNGSKRSTQYVCYILQLGVILLGTIRWFAKAFWMIDFLKIRLNSFFYIKHQGLEEFENKIEKISSGQDDNSWLGQLYSQVSPLLLTSLISIEQKRDHFWIFIYTSNS